eukprot:Filipodium_phascolosomae@DN3903_c0_g1_i1.p1
MRNQLIKKVFNAEDECDANGDEPELPNFRHRVVPQFSLKVAERQLKQREEDARKTQWNSFLDGTPTFDNVAKRQNQLATSGARLLKNSAFHSSGPFGASVSNTPVAWTSTEHGQKVF